MSDFVYLYRGREIGASPEKMQKTTEKWFAWFKQLGDAGHVKDMGKPLEHEGSVVSGTAKTVLDGPFAETKDIVGGFSIIEAESLEQAVELAKGCPILEVGGSIEVRPVQPIKM